MVGEVRGLKRFESAAVVATAIAVTLGGWWWFSEPESGAVPIEPVVVSAVEAAPDLVVHVSGAVEHPGVVRLPPGARAIDAIEAAGGARPDAVLSAVNLAAEVVDGSQIRVPSVADNPVDSASGGNPGPVVVNHAGTAELETLPGVGPVLAARIVAHREEHGPFREVEDLLDVSGIGESILARLRPHIRIP